MTDQFIVVNTDKSDQDEIFSFFDRSIQYQEERGYPAWKNYDKGAIIRDIESGNQYKIVVDAKIAIVFSVCYSDRVIWRHHEKKKVIRFISIVLLSIPTLKGRNCSE
jgi:hypothetical protein